MAIPREKIEILKRLEGHAWHQTRDRLEGRTDFSTIAPYMRNSWSFWQLLHGGYIVHIGVNDIGQPRFQVTDRGREFLQQYEQNE